ncbi:unnamed protein product [Durusdinium trenchii]|uniref:Pentatricopeptide repeat-containing protein, chloroplastic n=1 Tax=Durusdinium trenchii TaxID=1381693 RepID=A0ABP0H556_9DINO
MLQSMSGARFQRDVISYNGAASACERMAAVEETWEMALCLFQEANLLRVADPITSNSVLAACARAAAWPAALKLGCAAGDWGTIAANAVLRACASGLQWRRAPLLLVTLWGRANAVSLEAAVAAHHAAMQWSMALRCLTQTRVARTTSGAKAPGCTTGTWAGGLSDGSTPADAGLEPEDVLGRQINDFIKAMDRWNQRPRHGLAAKVHVQAPGGPRRPESPDWNPRKTPKLYAAVAKPGSNLEYPAENHYPMQAHPWPQAPLRTVSPCRVVGPVAGPQKWGG